MSKIQAYIDIGQQRMLNDVHLQHLSRFHLLLQDSWRTKGSSGVLVALGHLLRRFCRSHRFCRCWRNLNPSSKSTDNLIQPRMLRPRIVSCSVLAFKLFANIPSALFSNGPFRT